MLVEVRTTLSDRTGSIKWLDSEYEYRGTRHVLVVFDSVNSRRKVKVT